MEQSDNWRKAGEVSGGKGHLLTSITREDERYGFVRGYTACNRLTWVRLVGWSDLLWDDDSWACRVCQRHVRDNLESDRSLARTGPDPDRAERLKVYQYLRAITEQASQPGPVFPSRVQLIMERDKAREARRAMTSELTERGRTLRKLGSRIHQDGRDLVRLNELLSERELELRKLREDNKSLAKMAARAEVLRDVVKSLFMT